MIEQKSYQDVCNELVLVERERDELKAAVNRLADLRYRDAQVRDEALAKRDQMAENGEAWMRDCQLARAELKSARTELEQLRRAMDPGA